MCDTLALRSDGETWLAKNSDRDPLEAQRVEVVPPVRNDPGKILRCTWMEIPQVPDRHGCIIGRPAWMWGAEMGVNECGVAIGNEAIFSRRVMKRGAALLGMDLLRLALERADSAGRALEVIVDLLERHGQGGPAGYTQREFRYDNSFLVADAKSIWKLETAGRLWAAKRIEKSDGISNALTIERDWDSVHPDLVRSPVDFRRKFDTRLLPFVGASHRRRAASLAALEQLQGKEISFADFARILRRHRRGEPGGNADLCMHAAPARSPLKFLRPSHTVNAMIVRLGNDGPRVAFTGTPGSCTSLFRPVGFSGEWQVCERDLWERHRVWIDHQTLNGSGRLLLQEQLAAAEGEIFSNLQGGDLPAAEQQARHWANRIFNSGYPHNNHQTVRELV